MSLPRADLLTVQEPTEPTQVIEPATNKAVASAYTSSQLLRPCRWDLVKQYLPLLKSIVARMRIYFPENISKEDVYSIGLMGLVNAARNFDEKKGVLFGGYAKVRIRGALLDELRKLDTLSREQRSSLKKLNSAVDALESELKREPTIDEISSKTGFTKAQVTKISNIKPFKLIPLDFAPADSDSAPRQPLAEILSDPTELDGRDLTENRELVEILKNTLSELDPPVQQILSMYYLKGLRLAEIAKIFKLTESRICQIHSKALATLRSKMLAKLKR